MPVRLFISYSRKDEKFARRLATALSNIGADVWIDIEDIPAGMNWSKAIQQGLDGGQVLLLILSPDSMESDNVADEWQYYFDHGKPVVPILHKPARIHFQLNRLQYIDFHTQAFEPAFDELLEELGRKGIKLTRPENSDNTTIMQPAVQNGSSSSTSYRNIFILGGLALVIAIIGIFAILSQTNNPETQLTQVAADLSATVTDTPDSALTESVQTETQEAIQQATQEAIRQATQTEEARPTATPTDIVFPTETPTEIVPPTQTPTATPQLGQAGNPVTNNEDWTPLIREFDGVEMVLVPAGTFTMGASDAQIREVRQTCLNDGAFSSNDCNNLFNDESPQTTITFNRPFWIDRYEVTNAVYRSSGTHRGDNMPRTNITSQEAIAHCTTRDARLPTEAEWEYAARGVDNLLYPWGNSFDDNASNVCDSSCEYGWREAYNDGYPQASPVGTFEGGVSWVGAYDMAGNVWEWTNTIYKSYPYDPDDGREAQNTSESRTLRGSSWNWIVAETRTTARAAPIAASTNFYGFRCAMDFSDDDLDN